MQSPFYFITKPLEGKRYNNTKNIGGIDLIISTSEEDYKSSNRLAEVIETPRGYSGPIVPGDTLLVHHNAFKFYNDIKGNRKSGKSFFRNDIFLIEPDQFFLYRSEGVWKSYDKYCFVKPIPVRKSYINKPIKYEPLMGQMKYPNEYLLSKGINEGDIVCFRPDSEYEFMVEDETLYRMFDHQITVKL